MSPAQARACQARGDTPELWFCRDLKGYAWIFRKGNYLNIGLGPGGPIASWATTWKPSSRP